jgi:hypothetical protein
VNNGKQKEEISKLLLVLFYISSNNYFISGTNLVTVSNLDGVDDQMYNNQILPAILEQVFNFFYVWVNAYIYFY